MRRFVEWCQRFLCWSRGFSWERFVEYRESAHENGQRADDENALRKLAERHLESRVAEAALRDYDLGLIGDLAKTVELRSVADGGSVAEWWALGIVIGAAREGRLLVCERGARVEFVPSVLHECRFKLSRPDLDAPAVE